MSEAPERIWAFSRNGRTYKRTHWIPKEHDSEKLEGGTEYLRFDLAGLPDELANEAHVVVTTDLQTAFNGDLVKRLLERILAWHKSQRGGK